MLRLNEVSFYLMITSLEKNFFMLEIEEGKKVFLAKGIFRKFSYKSFKGHFIDKSYDREIQ